MFAELNGKRRRSGKRMIAAVLAATMLLAVPLQASAESAEAQQVRELQEAIEPLIEDMEVEVAPEGEAEEEEGEALDAAADGGSLEIPVLNPLKPYTNSKTITVEGVSYQGAEVSVWVRRYSDGYRGGTVTADAEGRFSIPITVSFEGPYSFTAVAHYSDGTVSAESQPVQTVIDIQAPDGPIEGKWTSPTNSQIEVSWKAPYGSDQPALYQVYRGGELAGETSLLYFLDEGLSPGTIYDYKVYGVDAAGNQSEALAITATTTRSDIRRVSGADMDVIRETAISPDGKTTAYVEEKWPERILHIVNADEGVDHQVQTEVGGPFYNIQLSRDGRYTVFSAETSENDHYTEQIFRYDRTTKELIELTAGSSSSYLIGARDDGQLIVYLEKGANYDDPYKLIRYDIAAGAREELPLPEPWDYYASAKALSADGEHLVYAMEMWGLSTTGEAGAETEGEADPETDSGNDSGGDGSGEEPGEEPEEEEPPTGLFYYNLKTYETKVILGEAPDSIVSMSKDGKKVAFADAGSIYVYATEMGELAELIRSNGEYRYSTPAISQDGSSVVFRFEDLTPPSGWSVNSNGLKWIDLTTGSIVDSFTHPGEDIEEWHIDSRANKLIYQSTDVTRLDPYGWFPTAAYVYCQGGVCTDAPPDEEAVIDSFTWKAVMTGGEAELGSNMALRLEGSKGMNAEAVVTYLAWKEDGTGSEERTAAVALAETSEGVYLGPFTLEEGIQEVKAIKASVEKGGKTAEANAARLPLQASGRLEITLVAENPEDLEGAALTAWSDARTSGNRSAAVSGPSLILPLQASDDYRLRLLAADGSKLAQSGLDKVVVRGGKTDSYTMSVQIPAGIEVHVENADGDPMTFTSLELTDPSTRKTLSGAVTDSTGRAFIAYGYVGESVDIKAIVRSPYKSPEKQNLTLEKHTKVRIVVENEEGAVGGTVTDEAGKPVAGVTVTVTQPGFTRAAVSDSAGKYSLVAPVGTSTIEAYRKEAPFLRSRGYEQISVTSAALTKDLKVYSKANGHIDVQLFTKLIDTDWEQIEVNRATLQAYLLKVTGENNRYVNYSVTTNRLLIEASPGETIQVCMTKWSGNGESSCAAVQLDERREGTAEIRLKESSALKGKVVFDATRFYNVSVRVQQLDASGKRIGSGTYNEVSGEFKLSVPKAGRYAVEFIGRARSYNVKPAAVYKEVEVGEEQFVELGDIEVREGGLFTGQANFLTAGAGEVVTGGTFSLRGSYKNDTGKPLSDAEILLVLPSGTTLVDGSVVHNGVSVTPEKRSDAVYVIAAGSVPKGQLGSFSYRLRTDSTVGEHIRAEARIVFAYEGEEDRKDETIGTSLLRVTKVTIAAPDRISRLTFEVGGRAPAGSKVLIYDQDQLVGEAVASPGGYYAGDITIEDINLNPYHSLKAVAVHNGTEMHSEERIIKHDPEHVQPVELVVSQGGKKSKPVDITKGELRLNLPINIGAPILFELKFNEPEKVENVKIYSGKKGFPATYDSKTQTFLAMQPPYIQSTAEPISVTYDIKPDPFQPSNMTNDEIAAELHKALPKTLQEWETEILPKETLAAESSAREVAPTVVIKSKSNPAARSTVNMSAEEVPNFVEEPLEDGQPPIYNMSYSTEATADGGMNFHLEFIVPSEQAELMGFGHLAKSGKKFLKLDMDWENNKEGLSDMYDVIESALEYQDTYDEIDALLHKLETTDCMPMDRIKYHAFEAEEMIDHLSTDLLMTYTLTIVGIGVAYSGVGFLAGVGIAAVALLLEEAIEWQWEQAYENFKNNVEADIKAAGEDPDCKPDDDDEPPKKPDPKPDPLVPGDLIGLPSWVFDPSGYVFEGVPSNRLDGVTATVTEKNADTGEYQYWDAEWYGQQNPQVTGNDGRYGWDVPVGTWQVQYRKDGYEPAQSAELVVLPPHFDVNIPMVSLAAPNVKGVYPSERGFLVDFSKYMIPETVTNDKITMKRGGSELAFTVEPADAEADLNGRTLASAYLLKVTDALADGDTVAIHIDSSVFSYAEVPMAAAYDGEATYVSGPSKPSEAASDLRLVEGHDGIGLTWTEEDVPLFKNVNAYWKASDEGAWSEQEIEKGIGTHWFAGLDAAKAYDFRIVTVDTYGAESDGVLLSGQPIDDGPPEDHTPPGDVSAFAGEPSEGGIQLTWKDPSDGDFYRASLELRKSGGEWGTPRYTAKGVQTYAFAELADGKYEVRIKAEDLRGNQSAGVTATVEIRTEVPVSDSPLSENITIANNRSGSADTITVAGLAAGDLVTVYREADSTEKLGSAAVAAGQTSAIVHVAQLGASAGQVYVSVTSVGKLESARVAKTYGAEPVPADTVAPVTKFRLLPLIGFNHKGWPYIKGFSLTLNATDNAGGSGVKTTFYRINRGAWQEYSGPITLTAGVTKVVEYYSIDNAGNTESPVNKMDFVKGIFIGAGVY